MSTQPDSKSTKSSITPSQEWVEDCLHWRGVVLTGKYAHWCFEYDGLPVDETSVEWPCGCSIRMPDGTTVDSMELARQAIAKAEGR